MSKIIDLHAHVVLEAGFGQAGKFGPELAKDNDGVPFFRIGQYQMKPMEYRGTVFMEIDQRLERMEQMGIDQQMLSLTRSRCFTTSPLRQQTISARSIMTRWPRSLPPTLADFLVQLPSNAIARPCDQGA